MSDRAIISDRIKSNDRWILHSNGKESRKDPFNRSPFVLKLFKSLTSIIDTFSDAWRETNQDITSFLGDKFGMSSRTNKVPLSFFSEMNGAAILEVSDSRSFSGFSFAVHRKIGMAVDIISFQGIGGIGVAPEIARNNGLSSEMLDDETEGRFCIIEGISTHGFNHERKGVFDFLEQGDCLMEFTDVGRMSDFPEGKFFLSISDDMISVAPEVSDLFLETLRKMKKSAQPSIGIPFGSSSFIKAVADSSFEIIFFDFCQDGARVHHKVFTGDDSLFEKTLN